MFRRLCETLDEQARRTYGDGCEIKSVALGLSSAAIRDGCRKLVRVGAMPGADEVDDTTIAAMTRRRGAKEPRNSRIRAGAPVIGTRPPDFWRFLRVRHPRLIR